MKQNYSKDFEMNQEEAVEQALDYNKNNDKKIKCIVQTKEGIWQGWFEIPKANDWNYWYIENGWSSPIQLTPKIHIKNIKNSLTIL